MKAILLISLICLSGCAMSPQQGDALFNLGAVIASGGGAYGPSYRPVAMFKGSQVSGFNRICYYDRVGSMEAINVPATAICPLQIP